jgi:predicted dithiol-disulfide oxidoreductase (DUF899 family)
MPKEIAMARKAKRTAKKSVKKAATKRTLHDRRFPNESAKYRAARDTLLREEIELRRQVERVAAQRRKLPAGGAVRQDYVFDEGGTRVRLSELFGDKDTLVAYSFMYGPKMEKACPSCTSILDSLDGAVPHVAQRVALAVIAKSPSDRIRAFARERGWRNLRLVSSAANSYNADYHGEAADGSQTPALNVFTRKDGQIRHAYCTELMFAPSDKGQDPRHVDLIWPLWNVFDFTPGGRGNWRPKLAYAG